MPFPIMAAMLAASVGSSIFGGMSANKANKQNREIALLNYYAQQEAQRRAEQESRRQQGESKLGQTDAAGNRTYFEPGRGWVTELSDDQQQLQDLTEQEQARQLTSGAERAERVDARANASRNDEAIMAQAAMDELRLARPTDEGRLRDLFLARGAEQRNRQADTVGNTVARQALRAGGGANAAELLTRARGASDQTSARQAGVDATLAAREEADREFSGKRDAASNMYDYFRRASTTGAEAPGGYTPSAPQMRSSGVADQGLINTLARSPQQEYTAPNNALAGTMSDVTSALQGFYNSRQTEKMNDAILQRWGRNTGGFG